MSKFKTNETKRQLDELPFSYCCAIRISLYLLPCRVFRRV